MLNSICGSHHISLGQWWARPGIGTFFFFSVKCHMLNILALAGQSASIAALPVCCSRTEVTFISFLLLL